MDFEISIMKTPLKEKYFHETEVKFKKKNLLKWIFKSGLLFEILKHDLNQDLNKKIEFMWF